MKKLIVYLILTFLGIQLQAQDLAITKAYSDASLKEIIDDMESSYPVKIFYKPEWDSLRVTVVVSNATLEEFCRSLGMVSELKYYIPNPDQAVLSLEYPILTGLPNNFFEPEEIPEQVEEEPTILTQLRDNQANQQILENQLIEIGRISLRYQSKEAVISGYLKDRENGEPLQGASIYIKNPSRGVTTDNQGYYEFTLPKGRHEVYYKSIGMRTTRRNIVLYSNGQLNVDMVQNVIALDAVEVTGTKENIDNLQTGMVMLEIKDIKQIPTILGEADILKVALTLPGVQSVGEGAAGINVRGGGVDQNLILFNNVPVYNPTHLFGFFSAFNPETLSSATLFKSGIKANYGGRVSSVFDVKLKEADKEKYRLSGGISPITAKVTVEGPVIKEKSSFLLGLRSTYSNWLFTLLDDPALRNSEGSFSDVILKYDHEIDEKNKLNISGYHSRDRFRLNSDSLYRYFNSNASIQWQHFFNEEFYMNTSASYVNYSNELSSEDNAVNANKIDYQINQMILKADFNYFPDKKYNFQFGMDASFYDMNPGTQSPLGDSSLVNVIDLEKERGLETAIYFGSEYEVNDRLSLYGGLRVSAFNLIGPREVFVYEPNSPKEIDFISDTINYSSGEFIKTYWGPEFRFSSRYKIMDDLSVKFSFDRSRQYIHMLSNTTTISPIDTWRLSNTFIKPQIGDQFSAGVYKSFLTSGLEISVEGYYKKLQNLLEYKNGANLLLNEVIETDVINADGKSYGVEFLLKKNTGKLTGWLSYTWSRAFARAQSSFVSEAINNGEFFPSNFDKPHNLTVISNYKFNKRISASLNMTYSSGRPITLPVGEYIYDGEPVLLYSDRNQFRIPDYFRVDLSMTWEGNHKVHKKIHGSWSFSVYNLTGRDNAYSVFFRRENGEINSYKLSVFAQPIPTVTYNFYLK